ncbi:MAG: AraC family transcriptional regulator [Clostridia bacterium]|nr:AraC family transcriptional regulator [Clostridia bacterium]
MFSNRAYLNKESEEIVDTSKPLTVTSCGYYRIDSGRLTTERPNGRKDYQLLYVASGKAHFFVDGSMRNVSKGSMVLFRPDEAQMYYYYSQDLPEVYWVHFTGSQVEELLARYGLPDRENVFEAGSSPDYQRLLRQMIQELQLRRVNFEEMLAMLLRHIFLLINRYFCEGQKASNSVIDEIEKATDFFNENYNRRISVEQYARDCHMSACWFIKTFKEITKMTPMQYIVSLRITNAMNLLDNTNYSISRIASAVGYDNALYFSRLFHKHTGLSPSEYKNRER